MSKTLSKALYLLTLFNEDKPQWRLDDLALKANIPRSTTYRLLKSLEEFKFLKKTDHPGHQYKSDHYQLGIRFLELGAIAFEEFEVRKIALPYMEELRDRFNESINLVVLDGKEALYIEKVESDMPVRVYTKIGRRAPLHSGACPRTLLSFLDDEVIDTTIGNSIKSFTTGEAIRKETVWSLIQETRINGYAWSDGELYQGSAAYAVPIFNRFGQIAAAISMAGFSGTMVHSNAMNYVPAMWEAAASVTKTLGYRKSYPYFLRKTGGI